MRRIVTSLRLGSTMRGAGTLLGGTDYCSHVADARDAREIRTPDFIFASEVDERVGPIPCIFRPVGGCTRVKRREEGRRGRKERK